MINSKFEKDMDELTKMAHERKTFLRSLTYDEKELIKKMRREKGLDEITGERKD